MPLGRATPIRNARDTAGATRALLRVSATGVHKLDGKEHSAGPGNAMLTRPGSTHTIGQTGDEDLVLLIAYRKKGAG